MENAVWLATTLVFPSATGCGFPVLPVRRTVNDQPKTRDRGVDTMIL